MTGLPHIYEHNVSEHEVEDILGHPRRDMRGREDSRITIGQTEDRFASGEGDAERRVRECVNLGPHHTVGFFANLDNSVSGRPRPEFWDGSV